MSTQTDLVLPDGQASPVNKTFSARGASLNLAVYKDLSSGLGVGIPTITLGNRETEGNNGTYRVEGRLMLPVTETVDGTTRIAYKLFGKTELVAPNRATLQNRKDLVAFMAALTAHATWKALMVDFNAPT